MAHYAFLDENNVVTEVECRNAKAWTGVLIVKRRGSTEPDDWYCVMLGYRWIDLMRAVEFGTKGDTPDR